MDKNNPELMTPRCARPDLFLNLAMPVRTASTFACSGIVRPGLQAARACAASARGRRASTHRLCTSTVQVTVSSRCSKPLLRSG